MRNIHTVQLQPPCWIPVWMAVLQTDSVQNINLSFLNEKVFIVKLDSNLIS